MCGAAEKLQSSERYSNWKRDALKEQTMWLGPSQPVEAQARMVAELVAMQREQAAVFHGQAEQLHDWSERRMQLIMSLTAQLVPEHQRNLLCLSLRSAHGEDLFCLIQRSLCRLVQRHRPGRLDLPRFCQWSVRCVVLRASHLASCLCAPTLFTSSAQPPLATRLPPRPASSPRQRLTVANFPFHPRWFWSLSHSLHCTKCRKRQSE